MSSTEGADGIRVPEWALNGFIGLLTLALAAVVAWTFNAEARLSEVERLSLEVSTMESGQQELVTTVEVLEVKLTYIESGVDEIKGLLLVDHRLDRTERE